MSIKKYFTFFIILSIVVTSLVPYTIISKQDETTLLEDVEFLKAFGIMTGYTDGTFGEDKTITRAELVKMIVRAINLDISVASEQETYYDVPKTHWAYSAIKIASDMGIVKGDGNGFFYPSSPVSYQEVLKVCVNMLGYGVRAEAKGGYPAGYIAIASELHLTDGMNFENSSYAKRGDVATLFVRMLKSEIAESISYNGKIVIEKKDDYTLIEQSFDLTIVEGKLDCLNKMTTSNTYNIQKANIDGVSYNTSLEISNDLFAKNVVAYCKNTSSSVKDIVYIHPDEGITELVLTDMDDLKYSDFTYRYITNDGREKRLKVSTNADIIYNGRPLGSDLSKYVPTNGYIKFIDNLGSGTYDSVLIYDYKNYVVGAIDKENSLVYDKYDPKKILDLDGFNEEDGPLFVTDNGKKISPNLIAPGQVISVLESVDKSYVYAEMQSNKVIGTIDEIEVKGDNNTYITIDGNEYPIGKDCITKLKAGDNAVFYFDKMQRIVSVEKSEANQYGYVIDCGLYLDASKNVQMRMLDSLGQIKDYSFAQKVNIDKKPYTSQADMDTKMTSALSASKVVCYSLNENGEIKSIDTLEDGKDETDDKLIKVFDSGLDASGNSVKLRYKTTTKGFGEKVYIGPQTVLFTIDENGDSEEETYTIENYLKNDGTYAVTAYATDKDDYIVPGVIVVTVPKTSESTDTVSSDDLYVITKISKSILNDDAIDTIEVFNGSSVLKYYLMEKDVVKRLDLAEGDVVVFDVSTDNKIRKRNIIKVFDYDKLTQVSGSNTNYNAIYRVFSGYVDYNAGDGYIAVRETLSSTDYNAVNTAGATPIVVTKSHDGKVIVQTGNINGLVDYKNAGKDCTFVVIRTYYSTVSQVIAFK